MVIFDQGNVAVAPALTVLTPPISVEQGQAAMRVEIVNNDVVQTLDVHFDKSETAVGPWSTSDYSELEAIQPAESVPLGGTDSSAHRPTQPSSVGTAQQSAQFATVTTAVNSANFDSVASAVLSSY